VVERLPLVGKTGTPRFQAAIATANCRIVERKRRRAELTVKMAAKRRRPHSDRRQPFDSGCTELNV